MMDRLPLDYEYLYVKWREVVEAIKMGKSIFPPSWPSDLWESKLQLLHNIVKANPDTGRCDRCGQCCQEFPFACRPVEFFYLLPYMALKWPQEQQKSFFYGKLGLLREDGRNHCPFWETAGCTIYPVRPLFCRRAICGDHICNKLNREFDSLADWCNYEPVLKQLTFTNMVYYFYNEQNQSEELSWQLDFGQGDVRLTVAPMEVWLLLLLNKPEMGQRVLDLAGFKPLLGSVDGLRLA
ncbi:zinc/iron-chelating domain-containing protein [Desulforamulus ferrireducens]|uniref:Zinc/iron-chelating domain-containing protein n=2 Tax=Desulforamulus ferrireducens TaxID=1833852 RepID=A0A1S6ITP6_9FIRM|nr:zinc/iron-chelating domain-containing protein [Desulforamulus ferrireducens]